MIPNRSRARSSRTGGLVEDRDAEHPAQTAEHLGAVLLVEVRQHLGVRRAAEDVTARLEVQAELVVVEDLAVEDRPDRPVLVRHRLVARRREVDDPQPRVQEKGILEPARRRAVGPAMADRAQDLVDAPVVDVDGAERAGDTAHQAGSQRE